VHAKDVSRILTLRFAQGSGPRSFDCASLTRSVRVPRSRRGS